MMPHPRTPPTAHFPRTTCRTPIQPPHFSNRHNAMPPSFPATLRHTNTHPVYPQRNNYPRPNAGFPIPQSPPDRQPAPSPRRTIGCLAAPSDLRSPGKRSLPSCPPRPTARPHATGSKTDTLLAIWIYMQHTARRGAIALFFRWFSAPPKSRKCCFLRIIAIFVSSKIGACLDKNFLNISITSKSFIYVQRTS